MFEYCYSKQCLIEGFMCDKDAPRSRIGCEMGFVLQGSYWSGQKSWTVHL